MAALKRYLTEHTTDLVSGANDLNAIAQQYYDLASSTGFDYQQLWATHGPEVSAMLDDARQIWTRDAHGNYELTEGLVAGIPALGSFDVWIDAGPAGSEDPVNARDWDLTLPDGTILNKPGNLFHSLTEPTLWGTTDAFVGLRIDMNGDGKVTLGEALPDANLFLGETEALVTATSQLADAVAAWEPTLSDALTALVVMIPTANGYFEEWRLSPYVLGTKSDQEQFVANSRLLDVLGIYSGLKLTYDNVNVEIAREHPELAAQIKREMDALVAFVQDLYDQERAGKRYEAEEAELLGREVQARADSLAGEIAQAAALLGVEIQAG